MPEFHCRYGSQKANFVVELMNKNDLYLLINQLHLQKTKINIIFKYCTKPTPHALKRGAFPGFNNLIKIRGKRNVCPLIKLNYKIQPLHPLQNSHKD